MRTFEEWTEKFSYDYIITRPTIPHSEEILIRKVRPYLNTKYGYVDLIRHLIRAKFGIWLGSKREDKNIVCSEFVMRFYGMKNAYKATPMDAYVWCLENDFEIINQQS
jgi:hypothetical protein